MSFKDKTNTSGIWILVVPSAWRQHITVINPSHPQTWPRTSDSQKEKSVRKFLRWLLFLFIFCFFPPRHKSLPAPQDKVYLQQSPAVVTKAARQQYRTGSFFAPCYTSIRFDAFKLEAAQRQVKTSTSCWMLLKRFHLPFWLPPCLENWNKPPLHVTLAVVWHISYCGESNNVTLCETYSAYQRFFAVQTIAHWHLFFYPYLWESRADPGSVI